MKLLLGNSLEVLRTLAPNSVDSIVTDPPYGLSFMGKKWDYDVPSVELWREVFRVLKPGGHVLSFGGTRTYHRMVVNIEDAGFEIRDQIMWIYGSGFPKSHDVSKAIDKAAGAEREVVGEAKRSGSNSRAFQSEEKTTAGQHFETAPATDLAKQWQGWGTALKPANEPIVLARKPLVGTVAANVAAYGTGALNIEASRIASTDMARPFNEANNEILGTYAKFGNPVEPSGRWPANVLFDEEAAAVLDAQSGILKPAGNKDQASRFKKTSGGSFSAEYQNQVSSKSDSGGASRFFYVAKASKRERGEGNVHPTVKPVKLMEYLIKLVTPPGGTVLDPFMGSGTTGVAARNLGFDFVGVELSDEYLAIAKVRIGSDDEAAS